MDQASRLIQQLLETCTTAQALTAAKTLIAHCPISLTDPNTADTLQLLVMQLMQQLPFGSERLAADLQILVDLLTTQRLCAEFAPSLATEYAQYLQQAEQLKALQERAQQQQLKIKQQEALIRDYQAHSHDAETEQELQKRNARQEQSIHRLQEEAKQAKTEITQLRDEVARLQAENTQDVPESIQQKMDGLEKTVTLLNKQYKEQLRRNIELREENARNQMQIKRLKKNHIEPEELAKLKERIQRQEETIRNYQEKAKEAAAQNSAKASQTSDDDSDWLDDLLREVRGSF